MKKYKMTRNTKEEKRRLAYNKRSIERKKSTTRYNAKNESVFTSAKPADLNRRFLAAFLALVFALSTIIVGINFVAKADTQSKDVLFHNKATMDSDGFVMQTIEKNANGLSLAKGVKSNGNGSYDIKLESYSTGERKKVPTDFVLVLDQSGSMDTVDMATDFTATPVHTNWTIKPDGSITNTAGNINTDGKTAYYKKVTDENGVDHYYRVYTKRGEMYTYYPSDSLHPGNVIDSKSFKIFQRTSIEQSPHSAYYYKDANGKYNQLRFLTKGKFLEYTIDIGYIDNNGNTITEPFLRPSRPDYLNILNGSRMHYIENPSSIGDYAANAAYWGVNNAVQAWTNTIGGSQTGYTYGKIGGLETGMFFRFPMYKRYVGYNQLCYTDIDGVEHKLIDAEYCSGIGVPTEDNTIVGKPLGGSCSEVNGGKPSQNETSKTAAYWSGELYTATEMESRLESLNSAAKTFIDRIAEETTTDEQGNEQRVDHRIAVVGFASDSSYRNTELLSPSSSVSPNNSFRGSALDDNGNLVTATGSRTITGYDGPQYNTSSASDDGNINQSDYSNALVSIRSDDENDPEKNVNSLKQSIDYVTAYGGTEPQHGFNMARHVFSERNDETYVKTDGEEALRNTVVIFFTDGRPGNYSESDQYDAANKVVSASQKVKTQKAKNGESLNTKVYSIGVFGESDGNPLTYPKYSETDYSYGVSGTEHNYSYSEDYEDHLEIYPFDNDYVETSSGTTSGGYNYSDFLYRAWHSADSDYSSQPDDTIRSYMTAVSSEYPEATSFSDLSAGANHASVRGEKGSGKYYYLASDRATLSNSFKEIFEKEAQSDSYYNPDNSYFNDTISPEFDTTHATLTIKTMSPTGFDDQTGAVLSWENATSSPGDAVSSWQQGDRTIKVDGFDYTKHYVSKDNLENGENLSRKLVVILSGVTTSATGNDIKTNIEASSGIYYKEPSTEETPNPEYKNENKFPVPSISRIKYTIRHLGDKLTPQLSTKLLLQASDGSPVSSLPSTIKIYQADEEGNVTDKDNVSYPENTTLFSGYDWVPEFENDTDYAIIFENLVDGYKLKAVTTNADSSDTYTYTWGDGTTEEQATNSFDDQNKFEKELPLEDHDLVIKSKTNNHNIIIRNETVGPESGVDYSDKSRAFPIKVILTKDGEPATEFDETVNDVQFVDGVATIPMKDGDEVELSLPVGYAVKVIDDSEPPFYTLKYKVDDGSENDSPAVTDTNADRNVLVKHIRQEVTDTGIVDDSDSSKTLFYALIGAIVFAVGAGAVYIYRKKNEFAGQ